MKERDRQRKGSLIALVGVLFTTPDPALLRWAKATRATLSAILCWKLLLISVVMFFYGRSEQGKDWASLGKRPVLAVCIGVSLALKSTLLSFANLFTYAATASMLFALHPLWSGVMGYFFLGDALPRRTIVALILAMAALVFMFYPELAAGSFGSGTMTIGDGMALATSVTMSTYLCLARYASRVEPELSVPTASSFGLFAGAATVVIASSLTGSTVVDGITGPGIVAIILDGFAVAIGNLAHALAPKYVTATKIGLISLIEAVLSPVWVFAIYREAPDTYTLAGGACIIVILAGHELLSCWDKNDLISKEDNDGMDKNDLHAALLKTTEDDKESQLLHKEQGTLQKDH